jgi:hypothetical protein
MAHMLADLTGIPAVYDSVDGADWKKETTEQLAACCGDKILVRHLCLSPPELFALAGGRPIRVIFLYRDPRDVIASDLNMRKYCEGYRPGAPPFPDMSFDEILEWELHHLLDYYTRLLPAWVESRRDDLLQVRYEDLLADAAGQLRRAAHFLGLDVGEDRFTQIADRHDFARVTGRAHGQEDKAAHARSGVVGDFRNQLAPKQQARLNDLLGETLNRLGYAV